jgi:hypothetical protein
VHGGRLGARHKVPDDNLAIVTAARKQRPAPVEARERRKRPGLVNIRLQELGVLLASKRVQKLEIHGPFLAQKFHSKASDWTDLASDSFAHILLNLLACETMFLYSAQRRSMF